MPRTWHDRHATNAIKDEDKRALYQSMVADKKPYFMRYIYPSVNRSYTEFVKNTMKNALREFGVTVEDLVERPYKDLTPEQRNFLKYYYMRMPVGISDCVMNRICRRIEEEFDGWVGKNTSTNPFDYNIMKSGVEYSLTQLSKIRKLYEDYNRRLRSYSVFSSYERVSEEESANELYTMEEEFKKECAIACPNRKELCDIILDIMYNANSTKKFAFAMVSDEIIENLLDKNDNKIRFVQRDDHGDIIFRGERYSEKVKEVLPHYEVSFE